MSKARRPDVEFEKLEAAGAHEFTAYLENHLKAIASGDPARRDKSIDQLAVQFGNMLAFADLLGRRRSLLEGKELEKRLTDEDRFFFQSLRPMGPPNEWTSDRPTTKTSPRTPHRLPYRPYDIPGLTTVSFDAAVDNLATRVPELALPNAQGIPAYKAVQALYQTEHSFALAHATHLALANRMEEAIRVTAVTQEALQRAMTHGISGAKFERAMSQMHGFSSAYSEQVFRSNMSRAYNGGRKEQVRSDPTLQYVIPAFEFHNPQDKSSRGNHAACNGIIAAQDAQIWDTLTPPLGYNCRCVLLSVNRYELMRRKLLNEKTGMVTEHIPKTYFSGMEDPATKKKLRGGPDEGFGATGPGPGPYSGGPPMGLSEAWHSVGG